MSNVTEGAAPAAQHPVTKNPLEIVRHRFLHWLLVDPQQGVIRFATAAESPAIKAVADLHERAARGDVVLESEWDAARDAARAAARDAARAAARDAARAAARDAARAAAWAAARAAAWAAAWDAAWAAAWAAAWDAAKQKLNALCDEAGVDRVDLGTFE